MFKLNFTPTPSETKISSKDSIYLIGSCFSDEIGNKLELNKFSTTSNPFGTIYNPLSIFKLLQGKIDPTNHVESQEVFYHWDCHGSVSSANEEGLENELSYKTQVSNAFLSKADWLIITFGTSYVYELNSTGKVVANCHKVPAAQFTKRLLTSSEIESAFDQLHSHLKSINSTINILLTVSPVRHIRDGLVENNKSKSILINSIHRLIEKYQNTHYFPSYEIVIDELRDYRFFKEDMIHPSEQAINYVWEVFMNTYFDEKAILFIKEWQKIRSGLSHRPIHPNSAQHQSFLKKTLAKLETLNETIDVEEEISTVKEQLL